MQLRKVTHTLKGVRATDGAGVSLVRVLGANTTDTYDPFLMLDSFDSTDPEDYRAGFPMHPHRGIETVTFIARGAMVHEDHLGTKATVTDGEAQWLTAGSGAFHSEMPAGDGAPAGRPAMAEPSREVQAHRPAQLPRHHARRDPRVPV